MKKLLLSLLFAASVAQAASPFYKPSYDGSNGYPVIWLGNGQQSQTNPAAFRDLIGVTSGGGSALNLDSTQLATNASGVLHIISDNVETNSLFYSGSSGAAVKAADTKLRILYNSAGVGTVSWGDNKLKNSVASTIVDWEAQVLYSAPSTPSVLWNIHQLWDEMSGVRSVDWETRELFYADGATPALDWEDGVLNDQASQTSLDFDNREGLDSNGQSSYSWEGRVLTDASLVNSVSWGLRFLLNSAGGTNLDWFNSYLKDAANQLSIDYANRVAFNSSGGTNIDYKNSYLKDTSNQRSADYANRLLLNSSGGTNVDWLNSYLKDTSNQRSVEYATRKLKDSGGTETLDWLNRIVYGGWKALTNFGVYAVDPLNYGVTNVFGIGGIRTYQGFRYGTNDYIYGGTNLAYNTWTITDQGKFTTSTSMTATQGFSGNGVHFMIPPTNTPVDGDIVTATGTGGNTKYSAATSGLKTNAILTVTIQNGGAVITTGTVQAYPVAGDSYTISGWSITAVGASPTCTIDVWKIAQGTALPTVSNTIMGTKPALATGNALVSTTLTSWSTAVTKGDIWGVNVDAVANATSIVFQIFGYR